MNTKILVTLAVIVSLVIGAFIGVGLSTGYSNEEVQKMISDTKSDLQSEFNSVLSLKESEISGLNSKIAEMENQVQITIEDTASVSISGYLMDNYLLEEPFGDDLSNREIKTLLDSKVKFNGESYDVEEVLSLKNLTQKINGKDYDGNVYLNIPINGISYYLVLDSELDTSEINEEDTLKLTFLGKEIEITNWTGDEITIIKGSKYKFEVGEVIVIEGKQVLLDAISEDSKKVYVEVDGVGRSIEQNDAKIVNGLKIKVTDVFYSGTYAFASLTVGEEIEETITSSEEFEEDSPFEWSISDSDKKIGIVLSEEFEDLDDRKDFNALGEGDSLCLPNEYACIIYNGIDEEDFEDYSFELDDGLLIIEGKFQSGLEDYSTLYINDTKVYEDYDCENPINGEITLGDSDLVLITALPNNLIIEDIKILTNLTNVTVLGKSLVDEEDDYRTKYGSLIISPEDNLEENELQLSIPMNKLEGSITVM